MEGLRSKRAYGADQTCGRRSAEQIIGTERKRSRDERLRKNGFEFFRDDLYEVLKVHLLYNKMAQWLSWLERRPVTAEVAGSSPAWVVLYMGS